MVRWPNSSRAYLVCGRSRVRLPAGPNLTKRCKWFASLQQLSKLMHCLGAMSQRRVPQTRYIKAVRASDCNRLAWVRFLR